MIHDIIFRWKGRVGDVEGEIGRLGGWVGVDDFTFWLSMCCASSSRELMVGRIKKEVVCVWRENRRDVISKG